MSTTFPLSLTPAGLLGGTHTDASAAPVVDAVWYTAASINTGLTYTFPVGALHGAAWLTADMLLTGEECGVFVLELQEGETGPVFQYLFSLMPEASARLRMPLAAVSMNRWMYPREAALLKPRCAGERVDLRRVDRMRVYVSMMGTQPVHWCMTPFVATEHEPLLLAEPILPRGPLLDALGQSTLRDWPGKTRSADAMIDHMQQQLADAPAQRWPSGFSKWGGWTGKSFVPSGFFRTQWDDEAQRWWLVDPDGYVFWSAGQDSVQAGIDTNYTGMVSALSQLPPESALRVRGPDGETLVADYLQANFIRAFGEADWRDKWAEITLAELRRAGFNTVANWSDWEIARAAGFPYVRPLGGNHLQTSLKHIYRELPDVFDPQFDADAAAFAQQLEDTRDDPAFIGYFLMNEPTWGFAEESPAAGMLFNTPACASRLALADFLRERYGGDDHALSQQWGIDTTFAALAEGHWDTPVTPEATADLDDFSAILVEKYFGTLSAACKQVDPNHLNLGVRYHIVPPAWARTGMHSFDVFSINCYQTQVPADDLQAIHEQLNMPTLIGEWHYGALDVGLPATGVGNRAADQAARGQAYRWFVEQAAALPWCVGVHHFTHYDQSALGRFDGEAYNIGFYDVCNRPYEPLVRAARASHERLYPVALGQTVAFADEPDWLPRFFF